MNLGKIWDVIADKNIDPQDIFAIVEQVRGMDVTDEENLRMVIRKVAILAKKEVPIEKEDMLVKKIQADGVDLSLLNLI